MDLLSESRKRLNIGISFSEWVSQANFTQHFVVFLNVAQFMATMYFAVFSAGACSNRLHSLVESFHLLFVDFSVFKEQVREV